MKYVLIAVMFINTGCMSLVKDPGANRARKPRTVGALGFMYNPTSNFAIGSAFDKPVTYETNLFVEGKDSGSQSINKYAQGDNYRTLSRNLYSVNNFALWFPWRQSFFYIGADAAVTFGRYAYNEKMQGYSLTERSTNVEWKQTQLDLAVPMGLSAVYESGLTMLGGVGPRWTVAQQRRFIDNGEKSGVDVEQRDITLSAFEDSNREFGFQFLAMLGYAF